ncbi:hypothetical protein E4U21_000269 [Claviceps maximensis]|nr:hypothetical protein E4U21_000269 [Claviceps maximensis]
MLFSNVFTAASLALFTTVTALPSPLPVTDIAERDVVARALPKDFAKHAAAAIHAFGPQKTKTMMHSGIGPQKAFKVASGKHLQTVETTIFKAIMDDDKHKKHVYKDTLKKYCIDKETYCDIKGGNLKDWVEAWAEISRQWALYAEKETTLATTKKGPDATSFYKTVEEPILKEHHVHITVDDKE